MVNTGNKKSLFVTRTFDREMFLKRAAHGLSCQTDKDFVWCIVNDGGSAEPIEEVRREFESEMDIHVIHLEENKGMEAAGNIGIEWGLSGAFEYASIHDDDDVLAPTFLSEMTASFGIDADCVGVVCQWKEVYETLENGFIHENRRSGNMEPGELTLPRLAGRNRFPPIAMMFKLDAWRKVGKFDESLPVLGDWDFNLRLMWEGDLLKCNKVLAFQHIRADAQGNSANTVISKVALHRQMRTRLINSYARRSKDDPLAKIGNLLSTADQIEDALARQSWKARFNRLKDSFL